MNYAIVFRLLGYVMLIEGALLLLPAAASWIYGEWFVLGVFLITAAVSAAIGYALRGIKPKSKMFYMREGFAATSLSWIVISIVGAVPFVVAGCIPNPVDALFETVSGFTTTGASILPGVEDLPKGILFWRSFTHWIGGMGVLVFLLSLLPLTGGSHVNLMKAESPGPQVDKLVPKVQSTAKILYGIYFVLTVLEVVFLLLGGMPLFESMLTAFGTAGTGGFGFKNDSFTSFSPYIQWVVTIFMILFGVNFNAYFLLLLRKFNRAISEEVRGYFAIILVAIGIITANIYSLYNSFGEAVRQAAFQVGSIITTTGFSSCDFDLWHPLQRNSGGAHVHWCLRRQHRRRHQGEPPPHSGQDPWQGAQAGAAPTGGGPRPHGRQAAQPRDHPHHQCVYGRIFLHLRGLLPAHQSGWL